MEFQEAIEIIENNEEWLGKDWMEDGLNLLTLDEYWDAEYLYQNSANNTLTDLEIDEKKSSLIKMAAYIRLMVFL